VAGSSLNKIVIAGVGLIGGSLALGLREAGAAGRIVGVGRSPQALARARELGAIDDDARLDDDAGLAAALAGAEVLVLAAPVAQTGPLLARFAPYLQADTIVTDAGSTKGDVLAAARAALGPKIGQFLPGHPIAGSEASGVDAAVPELFRGRNVVLCALPENAAHAFETIAGMWRAVGATVHAMTAEQHDRVFAAMSHLPHVLSFALVESILASDDAALKLSFGAGSFRDMTRIAASSPEMWRDICVANRGALMAEIDAYARQLASLRAAIDAGDGAALERVFTHAREARQQWRERPATAPAATTAAAAALAAPGAPGATAQQAAGAGGDSINRDPIR
jgi:prephenate dehydrogenase